MIVVDVVVLAGGPAPPPAAAAIGRPVWSLPIASDCSILEGWMLTVRRALAGVPNVALGDAVVIVSEHEMGGFGRSLLRHDLSVHFAKEMRPHRGTAGVVADEVSQGRFLGSERILILEASASPAVDAGVLLKRGLLGGKVGNNRCVVGESRLGRYCGVAFCDRSLFDRVPGVGFFDLKEQLLPEIGGAGGKIDAVKVADRARRVRSRAEWLGAVQAWHEFTGRSASVGERRLAPSEGGSDQCVISTTASICGATVVSSIVMDEAVVEPGAIVARSIIGPGMRVRAGARIIDAVFADPSMENTRVVGAPKPKAVTTAVASE